MRGEYYKEEIRNTFQYNALKYNTITHYDLNNKHKEELSQ